MEAWVREIDRIQAKMSYHRDARWRAELSGDIPRMRYHSYKIRRLIGAWMRALSL